MNNEGIITFNNEKKNKRSAIKIIFQVFLLLLIAISLARIPYSGCFIDSFVFDYILGTYKYIIYFYLIFVLILKVFELKLAKIATSKRYLTALISISIALLIAITCVYHMVIITHDQQSFAEGMELYHNAVWTYGKHYDNFSDFFNTHISGGILAELIYSLLKQFIAIIFFIIAIPFLMFGLSVGLNRKLFSFGWMKRLFPHLFMDKNSGAIKEVENNECVQETIRVEKVDKALIRDDVMNNNISYPPVDYLKETGVDNSVINVEHIEKCVKEIDRIFNVYSIDAQYKNSIPMPLYTIVVYESNEPDSIDKILKIHKEISAAIKIENYIISVKGQNISFEFANVSPSKISLKHAFKKVGTNNVIPFGIGLNDEFLFLDLKKTNSAIVLGKQGSGTQMLTATSLISVLYTHKPSELEVSVLAANIEERALINSFSNIPHIKNGVISGIKPCADAMESLLAKLEHTKVKQFIVIDDFDLLLDDIRNRNTLITLIKEVKKHKSFILLAAKKVNNNSAGDDFYTLMDAKFILKLATEKESVSVVGTNQANALYGSGDGYFILGNKSKTRFQCIYMGSNELKVIREIIINFFNDLEKFDKK